MADTLLVRFSLSAFVRVVIDGAGSFQAERQDFPLLAIVSQVAAARAGEQMGHQVEIHFSGNGVNQALRGRSFSL